MLPVFRSKHSVLLFCALLLFLLLLPVLNSWIGHPSREQAYAGMNAEVGPIGFHDRELFHDASGADILFLGSSLVRAGVDAPTVEQALSAHLGRPAHVKTLALNWQGLDLQYFLLRDYLKTHRVGLIVWNLPVPGSRNLEPHVEAFRWMRFGEYSDAFAGLPLRYRMAIYGDMVLGAPRELLSHRRANRLSAQEENAQVQSEKTGYYGEPFVPVSVDALQAPSLDETLELPPYAELRTAGKPLNAYEAHFARQILDLAHQQRVAIDLLHIPIDTERGMSTMPERGDWAHTLHTSGPLIGVSSAALFQGISKPQFDRFYRDQHLNLNGSQLFTRSILPALLKAYDDASAYEK